MGATHLIPLRRKAMGKSSKIRGELLTMAVLAGLALWPAPAGAASLAEIKQRGYMLVVTEDDFRPFEFIRDGKPVGLNNELVERLKKYAPFEVRQEIIPWQGILAGVSTGKYDVAITAVAITKARQATLDFSMPLADNSFYYVKRKGDANIGSLKDLSGKAFGLQLGSAMKERLPELVERLQPTGGKLGAMTEFASYPDAYQALAAGRVDFVINNWLNLNALVSERPNVFELGEPVSGRSMPAWAVKKGNAGVLAFLNSFLAQQRESGALGELQKKWLGKSFDDLPLYWMSEF
jgi:polar amino acid transport system substrate-binding protein